MLRSLGALLLAVTAVLGFSVLSPHGKKNQNYTHGYIEHNWGELAPYYTAAPYEPPPASCRVTQVNILQRHGARYPSALVTANRIKPSLSKLQAATNYSDNLMFLRDYIYTMGEEDLIPLGAKQSIEAGEEAFHRYSDLLFKDQGPFIRASGQQRVVDSAGNWSLGLNQASDGMLDSKVSVIISESHGSNNTLDDISCPNRVPSTSTTNIWKAQYGQPIADRLNSQAPGANLEALDVFNIMQLCSFDTITKGALSPFCNLFTEEEFTYQEYTSDVDRFYLTGYGQPLVGPVQGVGYVNELIARLIGKPVQDNTQTNYTLDHNPVTFPLDRTMYADFSHDNNMIAIFSTLGLFKQHTFLDPRNPDPNRTWFTSRMVPFSGRMVVERLACRSGLSGNLLPNLNQDLGEGQLKVQVDSAVDSLQFNEQVMVRILVNDAVQPLEFCGANRESHHMCDLDAFVESQSYARSGKEHDVDFSKCGFVPSDTTS